MRCMRLPPGAARAGTVPSSPEVVQLDLELLDRAVRHLQVLVEAVALGNELNTMRQFPP